MLSKNMAKPQIWETIRTIQVVEPQIMGKIKNNPDFTAKVGEIGKNNHNFVHKSHFTYRFF